MSDAMQASRAISKTIGVGVRIAGAVRRFDNGLVALDGIDLNVAPGEFLAILGPSGCGKSTLLRLIAGLDQPNQGKVELASGHDHANESAETSHTSLPPRVLPYCPIVKRLADNRRAEIAYVFQDAHLLPWRSVLQNVALPLELMHAPRADRLEASRYALEQVGLAETIERYPAQLSGGQRMRVSLARAMVTQPRLLLLDEPFAALDEITRQRLDEQLREIWAACGMTVIFVTHSTTEAVYLARRAVVMTRRPGRIIADRGVELPIERDAAIRGTPEFAREMRFVYGALERGGA